jgi:hypothetical protein
MESEHLIIEDWWTEDQVELVKDFSRTWGEKTFKNVPGFWMQKDGHRVLGKLTDHDQLPEGAAIDNAA